MLVAIMLHNHCAIVLVHLRFFVCVVMNAPVPSFGTDSMDITCDLCSCPALPPVLDGRQT
eukprot:1259616-Amphidinium_carterae.1